MRVVKLLQTWLFEIEDLQSKLLLTQVSYWSNWSWIPSYSGQYGGNDLPRRRRPALYECIYTSYKPNSSLSTGWLFILILGWSQKRLMPFCVIRVTFGNNAKYFCPSLFSVLSCMWVSSDLYRNLHQLPNTKFQFMAKH